MKEEAKDLLLAFLACQSCWKASTDELVKDVADTVMAAAKELDVEEIAWGPAAHRGEHELTSDALALAVKNVSRTGIPSYTIVLRGTNPVSLSSWLFQDLDVAGMVPWTRCSPESAASDAWVSKGTDRAVALINGLETDQLVAGGQSLATWVYETVRQADKGIDITVTGHSLGGLLAPVYGVYLHDLLQAQGLRERVSLSAFGFSGPSAGNAAFARFADSVLDTSANGAGRSGSYCCYRNPYDVVNTVWEEGDVATLPGIYGPDCSMNHIEEKSWKFLSDNIQGMGYTMLPKTAPIPSQPVATIKGYLLQVAYQHVVPYIEEAFREAPVAVIKIVIKLLKELFGSMGPEGEILFREAHKNLGRSAETGEKQV